MPALICMAPKPNEVATPKTVAKMARMSTSLPSQPLVSFSPAIGARQALISIGLSLRKAK